MIRRDKTQQTQPEPGRGEISEGGSMKMRAEARTSTGGGDDPGRRFSWRTLGVVLAVAAPTSLLLIPYSMTLLGLVAGPLLFASGIAVLLGVIEAGSVWQGIASIPVAAFEVTLGIWLIVKGFNPSAAILYEPDKTDPKERDKMSLSKA
jgi:hypothetical protein